MSSVHSLYLAGNSSTLVEVECRMTQGLPALIIVGFANRAVIEARERLRSAFGSSRLALPPKRITVNLAPADLPKDSPAYDLALAVAILESQGLITPPGRQMFFGELGLNGDIKPVRGIIGLLAAARSRGYAICYVPSANIRQALIVPDITVVGVANLRELYLDLAGIQPLPRLATHDGAMPEQTSAKQYGDFCHIIGQPRAKRALQIAAAGHHHVLLSGAPGTGKSMLAKALPSILPPLSSAEILEVSHLHSLADRQYDRLVTERPLRSPHHSASMSSLIGGGGLPRPGEISLAHRGVLFLDELPEFRREVMEALRQPLEDRSVTVTRSRDSVVFPADFILVATGNPCPCGHFGSSKPCICPAYEVLKYQQRISGPLLDRIDLYVEVDEIEHEQLLSEQTTEETSRQLAARVAKTRRLQQARGQTAANGLLNNQEIKKYAQLTPAAAKMLNAAGRNLKLSARSYMRVLKVARSVADLENKSKISTDHIREALQYRRREAT